MIPVKASERARASVLEAVLYGEHPAVLVDSPPGAGKTELVEEVVATAVAHRHWRVAVIAPRAEQTYDIVRRLRADYKPMRMEVLHSAERRPPNDLITSGMNFVTTASRLTSGPGLVIATAAKLFHSVPDFSSGVFDLLVCDEAYQLPYKDLAPMVHLAKRILLVGDPGQLPPLIRADVARFEAAKYKVHWPAPKEFLRCHPNLKRIALPCSWRLTQDTVNFLQPTFTKIYPLFRVLVLLTAESASVHRDWAILSIKPLTGYQVATRSSGSFFRQEKPTWTRLTKTSHNWQVGSLIA
jgi:AAA domain